MLRMALQLEKQLQMPASFAADVENSCELPHGLMAGDCSSFYDVKPSRKERKAKVPRKKKARAITATIATQTEIKLRTPYPSRGGSWSSASTR